MFFYSFLLNQNNIIKSVPYEIMRWYSSASMIRDYYATAVYPEKVATTDNDIPSMRNVQRRIIFGLEFWNYEWIDSNQLGLELKSFPKIRLLFCFIWSGSCNL